VAETAQQHHNVKRKHKPVIDFPGRDVNLPTSIILTAYWWPFWRCVHRWVTL